MALSATALVCAAGVGCATPGNAQPVAGGANTPSQAVTAPAPQLPAIGHAAPAFDLPQLNGNQTVALHSLLGKKPILLNVWASWCGPCKLETPDLVKLAKQYGSQVQFVGVDFTSMDTVAQAKAFVINYHVPYLVLSDPKGAFGQAYGILSVPDTYVLSSKGTIVAIQTGMMTPETMKSLVQQAIAAG